MCSVIKYITLIWLAFVLNCGLISGALAMNLTVAGIDSNASVEDLLTKAESLRSKAPQRVADLLALIDTGVSEVTHQQRHRILLLKSHQLALKGKFPDAQQILEQLLTNSMHPNQHIRALYLLAKFAEFQDNYEQAFIYLNWATQLPKNDLSLDARHDIAILSADLFAKAQEFEQAIQFALESVEIALKARSETFECYSKDTLARVYRQTDRINEIITSNLDLFDVCSTAELTMVRANAELTLGRVYLRLNELEEAGKWFNRADEHFHLVDYATGILSTNISLAHLQLLQGKLQNAKRIINKSIITGEALNAWSDLVMAYPLAVKIAEQQGQLADAIAISKKYLVVVGKIKNNNESIRLAYLQTQFQIERDTSNSSIAKKEHQIFELEEHNQRLWTAIMGLGWSLAIILVAVVYLLLQRKKYISTQEGAPVDSLTSILSLDSGEQQGAQQYQHCRSIGQPFIALVADVDHLGTFNNNFGHDTGDALVQAIAGRLDACRPDNAILSRSDSDEFWLFVSDLSVEQLSELVEQLQQAVKGVVIKGREINPTLSVGVARGNDDDSLDVLMDKAVLAMNEAKHSGRNCWVDAESVDMKQASLRYAQGW